MELNTQRPWWLTDEIIEQLKKDLEAFPNPYEGAPPETDFEFDGLVDMKREKAQSALDILTKYNIPFFTNEN